MRKVAARPDCHRWRGGSRGSRCEGGGAVCWSRRAVGRGGSGENIELPASYGALVDNEYIVPPKEFRDALKESKKGFNIKDALSPRDSLESILRALDIDGDETQEHGKLIKGRDKKTAQTA